MVKHMNGDQLHKNILLIWINNGKDYENKINVLLSKMGMKNDEIKNWKKCNDELIDEMTGKDKEYQEI